MPLKNGVIVPKAAEVDPITATVVNQYTRKERRVHIVQRALMEAALSCPDGATALRLLTANLAALIVEFDGKMGHERRVKDFTQAMKDVARGTAS